MPSESDHLKQVRQALERGEWDDALDLLDSAGPSGRCAEGLELRAQAAYGAGRFEMCIDSWDALHESFLSQGDAAEAARAAAMVAMYLLMDTGLMAPVRGWLRRAERLVEGHDEVPAHALIAMVRAYERFMCGDMAVVRGHASRAIELGERLGVQPAVVIGRVATARVTILEGDLDAGLGILDEVGALLMGGSVDPLTTGMMLCELICAVQGLGMHDRAAEWTEAMERWRHGHAFGGINGRCRVHRAEMLRMSGPTDVAEAEALGACDELRPWMRREFGWPLTELGNIRLRRGDLDGAEEAFRAAHDHAWSPQPGLARVLAARGDTRAAAELIEDAISNPVRIPSKERPPFGDLCAAPLLEAQVEIAAATGDLPTARNATERLGAIAAAYPLSLHLGAAATLARARTQLLDGDAEEAVRSCGDAVSTWCELGAPYETAVARTVLAEALERTGHRAAAALELAAANAAFEAYGGVPPTAAVAVAPAIPQRDRPLDREPPDDATKLRDPETHGDETTPHTTWTFHREADTRSICFAGSEVTVRDLKGFRYLERLLADPAREFHVLDLVTVEAGVLPTSGVVDPELVATRGNQGIPVIDDEARRAYRHRLQEVDQDIEDARCANDLARLELAERDRDFLVAELSHAVGLGGRFRSTGSDTERARGSVTRCIRYALQQLGEHHPALAEHLRASVHTGTYCCYLPDPLAAVVWKT